MIKAMATGSDGKSVAIIGLSEMNVVKLKEGKPILTHLSEIGMDGELFIFYGKTEGKMETDIKKHFSIGTIVDKRGG